MHNLMCGNGWMGKRSRPAQPRFQVEALDIRIVPAIQGSLVNSWGNGFQAEVRFTNDTAAPITDWRVTLTQPGSITQIWNAAIESRSGDQVVLRPLDWNRTIRPGETITIGYLGAPAAGASVVPPSGLRWTGDAVAPPPPAPTPEPDPTPTPEPTPTPTPTTPGVEFSVRTDWGSGFTADMTVTNPGGAVNGWRVEFDAPFTITNIWNAVIVSRTGNRYVIQNVGYNGSVAAGATVSFGFNGAGRADTPTNIQFNGNAVTTPTPTPPPTTDPGPIVTPPPTPGVSAEGFFHSSGNQILDAAGNPVKIAGVNWFGMETRTFAPHGLWTRGYKEMMDQMKQLGFNTIRLPFSNELFNAGSIPNGIDFSKNPDLVGLSGLQILDRIVAYAGEIGLRIFLDHHRSSAGDGAEGNGLWYTAAFPESRWISDWVMLAQRYANNPTVIGADLHNEPHGPATWGTGGANDWRLAAERAGNAILAANPNWLIIVEGVESGPSGNYWWGGNLSAAGQFPVRLNIAGRLVYSPHDYPATVYAQSWFSSSNYPDNLRDVWDRNWGYLFRQNIAPILLGEFGTKLQSASDIIWLRELTEYLAGDLTGDGVSDLSAGQLGMSWTYWSWNPNSGDTGGILADDWRTVQQDKLGYLTPIQFSFTDDSN